MRHKLTGVVLVVVTGLILVASVNFFTKSQPQRQPVEHRAVTKNFQSEAARLLGAERELVSPAEATIATNRKLLPAGTQSILKVPTQLNHGDYVWNEQGVATGRVTIWVDLRRQMISAFRNGHEIGTAVIVYGAVEMPSPEGVFPVLRKDSDYHSRSYDAPMPYSLFITNDGVALHGSPMSSRRASHGCIGLPVEFAQKLFEASNVGDIVQITRSDVNSDV